MPDGSSNPEAYSLEVAPGQQFGFDWIAVQRDGKQVLRVQNVVPGSAADLAGLPSPCELLQVDGQPVSTPEDLQRTVVAFRQTGRSVLRLVVRRVPLQNTDGGGIVWAMTVRKAHGEGLGAQMTPSLELTGVDQGSPAEASGLGSVIGWQLTHVNGVEMLGLPEVAKAISESSIVQLRWVSPPGELTATMATDPNFTFGSGYTDMQHPGPSGQLAVQLPGDEEQPPHVNDVLEWLGLDEHGYEERLASQGYELASDLVGVERPDLVALGLLPGHANRILNMIFRMAAEAESGGHQAAALPAPATPAPEVHLLGHPGHQGAQAPAAHAEDDRMDLSVMSAGVIAELRSARGRPKPKPTQTHTTLSDMGTDFAHHAQVKPSLRAAQLLAISERQAAAQSILATSQARALPQTPAEASHYSQTRGTIFRHNPAASRLHASDLSSYDHGVGGPQFRMGTPAVPRWQPPPGYPEPRVVLPNGEMKPYGSLGAGDARDAHAQVRHGRRTSPGRLPSPPVPDPRRLTSIPAHPHHAPVPVPIPIPVPVPVPTPVVPDSGLDTYSTVAGAPALPPDISPARLTRLQTPAHPPTFSPSPPPPAQQEFLRLLERERGLWREPSPLGPVTIC
eukprot:Hpha_TRINITY_DN16378_c0_g7::TRINITY_DN16378_c0_g7_i1::g.61307::m.61307